MSGITIGHHDTGLWDRADKIQTGQQLGKNLSAEEAMALAKEKGGAELLVHTSGQDENAKYDVYALSVGDGKSLKSVDLFEHVDFEKDLPQKMGGKSVTIAAESDEDGHTYFGHIQSKGPYNGKIHANQRIRFNMTYDD